MTIFISDTHIGYYFARSDELLTFLQRIKDKNNQSLVLAGDIFEKSPYKSSTSEVVKNCFFEICKFKEITYIPGNHDYKLSKLFNIEDLKHFTVRDSLIYTATNGKQYYVCHGDEYDWLTKVTHFASESWFAKRFRRFMENFHDFLSQRQSHYENELIEAARWRGCDGVICGHSHDPCIETINGIDYINCGDWLKNCTAIIDQGGKFELLRF